MPKRANTNSKKAPPAKKGKQIAKKVTKSPKTTKAPKNPKKDEKPQTTPHIGAPIGKNAFGEVCICPGDPLRAKWIADRYLKDAV